ncbi:hypothetical protein AB0K74_45215, partial [Streptomyces sp. NPDC056159]|uniref:hypothetical protein n=1 Tax=Streptomyces sp. NPDC056159 TaxID=3155537 RepID=UPI003446264D
MDATDFPDDLVQTQAAWNGANSWCSQIRGHRPRMLGHRYWTTPSPPAATDLEERAEPYGALPMSGFHAGMEAAEKPYLNRSWNVRVEQVSRRGDLRQGRDEGP